ncbi:unnamed protein product, partial [Rotaria sordida]
GPELPIQVVQPYPTKLKPKISKYFCKPLLSKYSVTTWEPGANEVLTHGFFIKPSSTAFLATNPAVIITLGLEVLVQLVMAAITISPLPIVDFNLAPQTGSSFF